MLEVIYFSQKDVKARLLDIAAASRGLLLVTAVRHSRQMRPVEEREPFRSLERQFGDVLHTVVVADDGTAEGMWRDPVGDLADRLFPSDRQGAYLAASGYILLLDGQPDTVLKKGPDPLGDAWFLQEALAAAHPAIPRPDPRKKPSISGDSPKPPPPAEEQPPFEAPEVDRDAPTPPRGTRPSGRRPPSPSGAAGRGGSGAHRRQQPPDDGQWSAPEPPAPDPWKLLGIAPGTALADARKAFRALMTQYHPDKVAHLAPEFRELAERRTRELTSAWEQLERELE